MGIFSVYIRCLYYLCVGRDVNVKLCRKPCNWMCLEMLYCTFLAGVGLILLYVLFFISGKERSSYNWVQGCWLPYTFLKKKKKKPVMLETAWRNSDAGWSSGGRVDPFNEILDSWKNGGSREKRENLTHPHPFIPVFSLLSRSHKLAHTQTHFNHGETWQQISVSILHLINGNDSSVIHLSWVAFIFLSLSGEWTLSGWRPSLVIARSPKHGYLEDIFLSGMDATVICMWCFYFRHVSHAVLLNNSLFTFPFYR